MTSADDDGIRHALLQLLEANPPDEEKLLARFESRRQGGESVYSAILYILTHLSFSEAEAERHWRRIRRHREALRQETHRDVGLRVALLDYFVNVSRDLKNPKIIEISIYESTARSAVTDGLTGLFNHAYFLSALRRETQRSKRYGLKLSLAMLDLDDFKHLNDAHGHLMGDEVLVKTASLMTQSLREVDIAARYGGEEFALILPGSSLADAARTAERIRRAVTAVEVEGPDGELATVTASFGIAEFPTYANAEALIAAADAALYQAKRGGKDQVATATLQGQDASKTLAASAASA
jgi:diguanylate cyclase (GGDEF)-like protein